MRPLVLSDVGNSRHLSRALSLVEWTDWQTRRVAFRRERDSPRARRCRWAMIVSYLRKEERSPLILVVGSLEVEPRVPELKIS